MCECLDCEICKMNDSHCLKCIFQTNFKIGIKYDDKRECIICLTCDFASLNPECFEDDEDCNKCFDEMRNHNCEPIQKQ